MKSRTLVYAIIAGYEYESSELLKIFSSKRKAQNFVNKIRKNNQYDYIDIVEEEVW